VTHQHELGYTVIEETLVTQSYYLADGELIFTDFNDTIVPMPSGDYAVLGFSGEMVDCNNLSVPLDVLYNHHWLLKPIRGPTSHYNTPCPANSSQFGSAVDFTYVFGVGAESRRTPTVVPDGYGYPVKEGTIWGANIHVSAATVGLGCCRLTARPLLRTGLAHAGAGGRRAGHQGVHRVLGRAEEGLRPGGEIAKRHVPLLRLRDVSD